jgi:flagellar protein FlaI
MRDNIANDVKEDIKLKTDGGSDTAHTTDDSMSNQFDRDAINWLFQDNQYEPTVNLPDISKRHSAHQAAIGEDEEGNKLTEYQAMKLLYYVEREFVGYQKIDAIKNDDAVEDITTPGYNKSTYVYHKDHGNIQTNIQHSKDELDNFIIGLAQLSGEELSRRRPETDAKLPDGSRAELTLGYEVSDTGSSYTIRQFTEIPHTPLDLINWKTYNIDQMVLLWLFIEHGRSAMIAGGTGAGKTTSLNALSMFIPSSSRIVSIEDTQEIELPHDNWSASVTREAGDLSDSDVEINEFDLLKRALRKRPDRIILGEVRGQEAFELFQSIRTGHPGLTTFHAPSFEEVVDRMTTEPIGVPRNALAALDLVLIQGEVGVDGNTVRRNWSMSEIEGFNQTSDGNGEIIHNKISEWDAQTDTQNLTATDSNLLKTIAENVGWSDSQQEAEIRKRRVVLSAMVADEINEYKQVSATIQATILMPDKVLRSIALGNLSEDIHDLSDDIANISIKAANESNIDRPSPAPETAQAAKQIIKKSKKSGVLSNYV